MKFHCHKVGLWLICLSLMISLFQTAVFARESVDVTRADCTLTMTYPCPGIDFRLYRVADISASGRFTLAGDFKKYAVSFADLDSTGWKDLAGTLEGYIRVDQLSPAETRTTDNSGKLTFAQKTPGLYLVTWDRHTTGGYTYTPQPSLISLPGLDTEGNWIYDVTAEPKYEKDAVPDDPPDEPDTVNRRVWKVWRDDGNEAGRPESVSVQLLKNGTVYEEVTLNAANGWTYQWTGLDGDAVWQVVEKDVPDGYVVSIGGEGDAVIVTNTRIVPSSPPPAETGGDPTPPPSESGEPSPPPSEPGEPSQPPTESDSPTPPPAVPNEPRIPQTGQLWWPVPLLAGGGIGLYLAGWLKRRNGDRDSTDD